jgi:hypothetical protein
VDSPSRIEIKLITSTALLFQSLVIVPEALITRSLAEEMPPFEPECFNFALPVEE